MAKQRLVTGIVLCLLIMTQRQTHHLSATYRMPPHDGMIFRPGYDMEVARLWLNKIQLVLSEEIICGQRHRVFGSILSERICVPPTLHVGSRYLETLRHRCRSPDKYRAHKLFIPIPVQQAKNAAMYREVCFAVGDEFVQGIQLFLSWREEYGIADDQVKRCKAIGMQHTQIV